MPSTTSDHEVSSSVPRSGSNDISTVLIVSKKITSNNYREWSQSMIIALDERDKLEYINGEAKIPPQSETEYHIKYIGRLRKVWMGG